MPQPSLTDTPRLPATASPDLDRLVVLAGTFRDLPTDDRERLAERLASIRDGIAERLLLHTCHRAELIAVLGPGADVADPPAWRGADAIERVLTVVAGLDSAILAEEQLLGQVRDTYSAALARHETGPVLNELMRRALRFGKRVRSAALPGGDRSLAQRALEWIDRRGRPRTALIVGTGTVAREVASRLAADGVRLTVVSRSPERAHGLVASLAGDRHRVAGPDAITASHELIVLATRVAEPLLTRFDGNALVVDLCAPSGVDAALRPVLGDRLIDLDRLGHPGATLPAAVEGRLRAELADERDRFVAWLAQRGTRDEIVDLRRRADAVRRRHLDRLRRQAGLGDEQLAAVERMTGALVNELLHEPTIRLRNEEPA